MLAVQTDGQADGKSFQSKCGLFLVALNKAARWARELKKHDASKTQFLDAYLTSFEAGKDVRDMREHDDEYLTGRGRNPGKFMHSQPFDKGTVTIAATATMIMNGQIMLGGRLSVQAMMSAAEVLRRELAGLQ